jgi:2-C-methyl-D-erythritol 4-phosphate cytidylyltransferase
MSGGQGKRFGSKLGKQLYEYKRKPIMFYTIKKFQGLVDKIIVIIDPAAKDQLVKQLKKHKLKTDAVIDGGKERYDSVRNGLEYLRNDTEIEYVLIHDGARPNVSKTLIENMIAAVKKYGAVIPVVPVKDTIKKIEGDKVVETIPRQGLFNVQTPQCFEKQIILKAYDSVDLSGCTDDAMVVEKMGGVVKTILGEEDNIKITTKEDLKYLK